MSTGTIENWFGNMAELGPLYPFVGTRFILFCAGVVFWIGWQISCTRAETARYAEELKKHGDSASLKKHLD